MVSEKEILLIQRLMSEGVDELSGEWWITAEGTTTFDDGDVGEYTHSVVAMEHALGVQLDEAGIPILPLEPLSDVAIKYLKQQEAPDEAIEYLREGADPCDYAIRTMDWIKVKDNTFQVNAFDHAAANRISAFLNERLDDDRGNILVDEVSTGRSWLVPAWMIMNHPGELDAILGYSSEHVMQKDDVIKLVSMISEDLVPLAIVAMEDEGEGDIKKEYEQRVKLKSLPDGIAEPSEIKQGLLFDKPGFSLRIRCETPEDGEPYYTMTCKFYKKSDEAEVEITPEMYERLWKETIPEKRMLKTRYNFGDWVVDDISEPESEKGIVAEIETDEEDEEVEIPDAFETA